MDPESEEYGSAVLHQREEEVVAEGEGGDQGLAVAGQGDGGAEGVHGGVRGGGAKALRDSDELPVPAGVPAADGEGDGGVRVRPGRRAADPLRRGRLRAAAARVAAAGEIIGEEEQEADEELDMIEDFWLEIYVIEDLLINMAGVGFLMIHGLYTLICITRIRIFWFLHIHGLLCSYLRIEILVKSYTSLNYRISIASLGRLKKDLSRC